MSYKEEVFCSYCNHWEKMHVYSVGFCKVEFCICDEMEYK